jgi:hypothetical protein
MDFATLYTVMPIGLCVLAVVGCWVGLRYIDWLDARAARETAERETGPDWRT